MAGVLGINVYDGALFLGNPTARTSGLIHDPVSVNKIKDLVDEDTVTQFFWTREEDKKVPAFTGVRDGDAISYYYSRKNNCWMLMDTNILAPAVVASGMSTELKRLREEVHTLKQELATERLNTTLLRHEVERYRAQVAPPAKARFTYTQKVLLGIIVGLVISSLIPSAAAQNVTTSSFDWDFSLECYIQEFQDWIKLQLQSIDYTKFFDIQFLVGLLVMIWSHWIFHLAMFLVMGYLKFSNLTPTLIFGLLSIWSKWHANTFIPLSTLDVGNLFIYGIVLFLYPLNIPLSFMAFMLLSGGYTVACISSGNKDVDIALAGSYGTLVTFALNVLCESVNIPKVIPSVCYVLFRVVSFAIRKPDNYVVKNSEGKVVETGTIPPNQSAFTKFSQFLKNRFKQKTLRTGVSTTFQVPSEATVHVLTNLGTLTGFRAANYILTAKHGFDENDVCEIEYQGRKFATKVKHRHPNKDLVFLALPSGLQDLKPFKIAKDYEDGPVAIVSKSGEFVHFATADGVLVNDEITYAVTTADGTSGAPVVNPAGKIVGLHTINTGFSAGAIRVTMDDFPQPATKTDARVKALEEEIARLRAERETGFEQCSAEDVIHLIREAIQREVIILRKELLNMDDSDDEEDEAGDGFEQAKGKTKRGKTWRRNATHNRKHGERSKEGKQERKKRVWTEQEYKELQEQGYSVQDLKKMADEIRERQQEELDYATTLGGDAGAGYPEYDDPGSDYEDEVNAEWFKQTYFKPEEPQKPKKTFQQFWDETFKEPAPGITPVHFLEKYDTPMDEDFKKKMNDELRRMLHKLNIIKENAIRESKWVPTVDVRKVLEDVSTLWYDINYNLWENGMENFLQKKAKNGKKARANQGRKSTQ